ncbi:DUF4363 family protein [Romboutsia sp. CE17]|uniref:DUF4363 family protein n=1 Tax=Romboutsia sp. CE17 TaxID=2724150 RepID=UPI001442BBA6|nr:DUF4363 family protein [Romboutsia sp. CE17]QJA08515.1 DUF4363 family protein [Romboutsia sp. CE17]
MRSLIFVLIWTVIFTSLGIYTNDEIGDFADKYNSKFDQIEIYIEENNWKKAEAELKTLSSEYYNEKEIWYKLLDHTYFDDISLYINILAKSIYTQDKSQSFEEIEKIKKTLDNILETGKFDLNHIL